jgi:peroxiredoxin
MKQSAIYFLLAISTLLSACMTTTTGEVQNYGPELNTQVAELNVLDTNGQSPSIQQLSGNKGIILILFRSADWCPFCQKQLIKLSQWQDKFSDIGYNLVAISYDDISILKEFAQEKNVQYPLLSDKNNQTFKAYNVINQNYESGNDGYGIPYPGIMVISRDRQLTHKFFYEGHRARISAEKLYNQLK